MWKIILPLFLYLSCINNCYAFNIDTIILDYKNIPGSYRIEHGGIRGRIYKAASRTIRKEWTQRQRIFLDAGSIDIFEYRRRQRELGWAIQDDKNGGRWWDRSWFHSMLPEKGGASKERGIIYVGRTYTILDVGIFSLNNTGSIKWREYQEEFDVGKSDISEDDSSGTTWLVNLKPTASFSWSGFKKDFLLALKEVGFVATFTHSVRHIPMVEVKMNIEYDFHRKELKGFATIQLLQW